jgi:PKD repeat protein
MAGVVLLVALTSCTRVPLTAPTKSTISLYASGATVPINGSVDVIANIIEEAGTPVHNGTLVTFTTTLGHLEPASAGTVNGQATVKLVADGVAGTATVSAFSGGATAAGSGTTGGAGAATLQIPIGTAAVSVTLTATPNPATVNTTVALQAVAGGSVSIDSCDWDFGDSTSQTTLGALTTKTYTVAGTFHAKVTVHATDGSVGVGTTDVIITP